jgi:predicted chitinase
MPNLSLGKAGFYAPFLNVAMLEQDINSKRRRCAFLAQLAHESSELRYMEEIASGAAYEGRKDLGNIHPGDGKRFKGRGPIQLTGRANYRLFGNLLGLDLEHEPQIASKPEHAFRIAALFWQRKGLNELADKLTLKKSDAGDKIRFAAITKRINGGYNGLDDRLNYFRVAKQVLHNDEDSDSPIAPPTARSAESVREQEEEELSESAASQVASPGKPLRPSEAMPTEPETDLFGAAVKSGRAKTVGVRLWPRVVGGGSYLLALYEAHQILGKIVLIGLAAFVIWLGYHSRKRIKTAALQLKPAILKLLK